MIVGAVEIGLRSTRLAVSDFDARTSRTLIDREHRLTARLDNIDRLGALVMAEAEIARDAGADKVEVVASPEFRGSRLMRLVDRYAGAIGAAPVRIPTRRERTEAAFLAAARKLEDGVDDPVGVARIDEDAIGIAVGRPGERPGWVGTRPVGAVAMTRRARFFDPPLPTQIEAAIAGASRAIASLFPPDRGRLLVTSPLSTVVARLCGEKAGPGAARRGLDAILGQTGDDIAAWFGVGSARARQLPGVLVGHVALAEGLDEQVEPVGVDEVAGRHWLAAMSPVGEGR